MSNAEMEEKREFLRVDYAAEIELKVLKENKMTLKKDVFCRNLSANGLLFRTTIESSIPNLSSTVWVKLDDKMINICSEIESDFILYNNGIFGRVVRIAEGEPGLSYDVGICFLRKSRMSEDDIRVLTDNLKSGTV